MTQKTKDKLQSCRLKLYKVVVGDDNYRPHKVYTMVMAVIIILSLVPLAFREEQPWMTFIEISCVTVFIVDYLIRWLTADIKYNKGKKSFLSYPFRPMAIVDMLSILPTFTAVDSVFNLCRATRLTKTIRLIKVTRISKEIELFFKVLYEKRAVLYSVLAFALLYITFTALLMFNLDTKFDNFFESMYWATTTLTTVGYGDTFPHNDAGRILSMVSALVGVAVIALPSGIITASYLKALEQLHEKEKPQDNPK